MIINPIYIEARSVKKKKKKLCYTSTAKAPIEVSRVTSGAPPSELAHIFQREKQGFFFTVRGFSFRGEGNSKEQKGK